MLWSTSDEIRWWHHQRGPEFRQSRAGAWDQPSRAAAGDSHLAGQVSVNTASQGLVNNSSQVNSSQKYFIANHSWDSDLFDWHPPPQEIKELMLAADLQETGKNGRGNPADMCSQVTIAAILWSKSAQTCWECWKMLCFCDPFNLNRLLNLFLPDIAAGSSLSPCFSRNVEKSR